jgi:hypothetical protein
MTLSQRISALATRIASEFVSVRADLSNKVDKITGQSLVPNSEISRLGQMTAIFTTALKSSYDSASNWVSTNGSNVISHLASGNNPHSVTKAQVGLSVVPNTDFTSAVANSVKSTGQTTQTIAGQILVDTFAANRAENFSSQDLNTIVTNRVVSGNNMTNEPAAGWWYVETIRYDSNSSWILQRATSLGSGNIAGELRIRNRVNGTWDTVWKEIPNTSQIATIAQGVKADNSVQLTGESTQSIQGLLNLNDTLLIRKNLGNTGFNALKLSNAQGSSDPVSLIMESANSAGGGSGFRNTRSTTTFRHFMSFLISDTTGSEPVERVRMLHNGFFGFLKTDPTEVIDVVGNGKFSGTVTAANFIGSGSGLSDVVKLIGAQTVSGNKTFENNFNNVLRIIQLDNGLSNNAYTFEVNSTTHNSNMTTAGAMAVDVLSGRAFTINGFGNAAFGKETPTERLDVVGNGKFSGTVTASNGTLLAGTGTTNFLPKFTASGAVGDSVITDNGVGVSIGSSTINTVFQASEANGGFFFSGNTSTFNRFKSFGNSASAGKDLLFSAQNSGTTPDLYIKNNGNVSLGNTNPTERLDVVGNGKFSGKVTTGLNISANGVTVGRGGGTGANNTVVGLNALGLNTLGSNNSVSGLSALLANTTGSNNIAKGVNAGRFISNGANATNSGNSVFLGLDTRALGDGQTNQIVIGHTAIGAGSNTVTLGNTAITNTILRGAVTAGNGTLLAGTQTINRIPFATAANVLESSVLSYNSSTGLLTTLGISAIGIQTGSLQIGNGLGFSNIGTIGVISGQNALIFSTNYQNLPNGTEHARFNNLGNFGINQPTPTERLDVVGNVKATNFIGNLSGNAITANTLQNARLINGVSFNGSANITIVDSTKEPAFSKNTAFNKAFSDIAGSVAEGNDFRLSNARNPIINYNNNVSGIYQIVFGSGNVAYGTAGVTINPSTNTVAATTFKGFLNGRADSATNALSLNGENGSFYNHRNYNDETNFLGGYYVSGGTQKPNNTIFGAGKLKLAMLSSSNLGIAGGSNWNDVLYMSSYTGSDVKLSNALAFSKGTAIPEIHILNQNYDSATWGTPYRVWHSGNSSFTSETLQTVTDRGNTTTNDIKVSDAVFEQDAIGGWGDVIKVLREGSYRWALQSIENLPLFTDSLTVEGTVTATDFIGSSDIRLKENIKTFVTTKINSNYKTFNFTDDDTKQTRTGVIAQELEVNHPEFVRTDSKGMKSVSYGDLHSAEIAYLKSENEMLKAKLELIMNKLGI